MFRSGKKKPININILGGTVLGTNRNRPWDKRDKWRLSQIQVPVCPRDRSRFVPGTVPVCPQHFPTQNVYVYWVFSFAGSEHIQGFLLWGLKNNWQCSKTLGSPGQWVFEVSETVSSKNGVHNRFCIGDVVSILNFCIGFSL